MVSFKDGDVPSNTIEESVRGTSGTANSMNFFLQPLAVPRRDEADAFRIVDHGYAG